MPPKHPRAAREWDTPPAKRLRLARPSSSSFSSSSSVIAASSQPIVLRTGDDLLSPLSDEILVRILSYLSLPHLLSVAPVSQRFHRLAEDSQLWKALYYARFVLPRAMRIPGFRDGKNLDAAGMRDHKLHYKGRRTLWADGRLGGLVREVDRNATGGGRAQVKPGLEREAEGREDRVNWKRQYKIRHNWAKGKCAVEELKLGPDPEDEQILQDEDDDRGKMLVKVVEGLAVTVDGIYGLRAWDLKTKEVMAHHDLHDDDTCKEHDASLPSCLAIDDRDLGKGMLDIAVGFTDGSFGVWRLRLQDKNFVRRYQHEKSSNGELLGMSYSYPYLLTATGAVLISLYTFDVPEEPDTGNEMEDTLDNPPSTSSDIIEGRNEQAPATVAENDKYNETSLPAPYLLTSLKSHTSDPPLALSIRKMAGTTVASIAYTFFTRQGWSIGIQDLHITPNDNPKSAPNITTRLAYTTPVHTNGQSQSTPSPPRNPGSRRTLLGPQTDSQSSSSASTPSPAVRTPWPPGTPVVVPSDPAGPTTLCYTHPYLLATLPDNTLILHLCMSNASALSISPGLRLWGHTSGISDAEITARGKAVSVSSRGEEMRVWELEGRPSGLKSRSVEIRPGGATGGGRLALGEQEQPMVEDKEGMASAVEGGGDVDWEERRNWVGFDDEMVIVLKEARGGRESLLVYDFT